MPRRTCIAILLALPLLLAAMQSHGGDKVYRWVEKRADLAACVEALKPVLAREQVYRQRQNYQTVIEPAKP